jgi:hypothetical protein
VPPFSFNQNGSGKKQPSKRTNLKCMDVPTVLNPNWDHVKFFPHLKNKFAFTLKKKFSMAKSRVLCHEMMIFLLNTNNTDANFLFTH